MPGKGSGDRPGPAASDKNIPDDSGCNHRGGGRPSTSTIDDNIADQVTELRTMRNVCQPGDDTESLRGHAGNFPEPSLFQGPYSINRETIDQYFLGGIPSMPADEGQHPNLVPSQFVQQRATSDGGSSQPREFNSIADFHSSHHLLPGIQAFPKLPTAPGSTLQTNTRIPRASQLNRTDIGAASSEPGPGLSAGHYISHPGARNGGGSVRLQFYSIAEYYSSRPVTDTQALPTPAALGSSFRESTSSAPASQLTRSDGGADATDQDRNIAFGSSIYREYCRIAPNNLSSHVPGIQVTAGPGSTFPSRSRGTLASQPTRDDIRPGLTVQNCNLAFGIHVPEASPPNSTGTHAANPGRHQSIPLAATPPGPVPDTFDVGGLSSAGPSSSRKPSKKRKATAKKATASKRNGVRKAASKNPAASKPWLGKPSRHCHICQRTSSTTGSPHFKCAAAERNKCRKTVCLWCVNDKRVDWPDKQAYIDKVKNDLLAVCPHCEGKCPKSAQCNTYRKVNWERSKKIRKAPGATGDNAAGKAVSSSRRPSEPVPDVPGTSGHGSTTLRALICRCSICLPETGPAWHAAGVASPAPVPPCSRHLNSSHNGAPILSTRNARNTPSGTVAANAPLVRRGPVALNQSRHLRSNPATRAVDSETNSTNEERRDTRRASTQSESGSQACQTTGDRPSASQLIVPGEGLISPEAENDNNQAAVPDALQALSLSQENALEAEVVAGMDGSKGTGDETAGEPTNNHPRAPSNNPGMPFPRQAELNLGPGNAAPYGFGNGFGPVSVLMDAQQVLPGGFQSDQPAVFPCPPPAQQARPTGTAVAIDGGEHGVVDGDFNQAMTGNIGQLAALIVPSVSLFDNVEAAVGTEPAAVAETGEGLGPLDNILDLPPLPGEGDALQDGPDNGPTQEMLDNWYLGSLFTKR